MKVSKRIQDVSGKARHEVDVSDCTTVVVRTWGDNGSLSADAVGTITMCVAPRDPNAPEIVRLTVTNPAQAGQEYLASPLGRLVFYFDITAPSRATVDVAAN